MVSVALAALLWALEVLAPAQSAARPSEPISFTKDIAPILYAHCATCHRPEGSAPFSLLTYSDAKERAGAIAAATSRRFMPPWKPEPGYGEFADVRRLADAQVDVIQRWVAAGAPEGDPRAAPPIPQWTGSWQLGRPDLVLTMARPYTLRAAGDDVYRHFVIPIPLAARRYVKAWELRVNNTRVVHHATMEFDATGASARLDNQDPEPGYEGIIAHSVMAPDGYFLDWAPGHTPYVSPAGMAFPVEKGSDLVLMLHLRPSGKPEVVEASVGLYFSNTPPTRVPALLRLTRQDIEIPAGAARHVITDSYKLPVDLDIFTVQPHAHNLARQIEGFATLPDGSTKPLLLIKDWDFNWQGVYRYATPVSLPAGSTVTMRWTYDNSTGNVVNPNRPPRRVTFGQRTSDEMSELWFQVFPRNSADRAVLVRDLRSHVQLENINGYEQMLHAAADNAALHDDVALLYVEAGRLERAAQHFEESVRIKPESPAAYFNLGTALFALGKRDEARRDFLKALELDPTYATAYRGLGTVMQAEGKVDEAARYYEQAIQRAPNDAMAHHHLGMVLQAQGKHNEALARYRDALRLNADYVDALVDLAWALATSSDAARRRPGEALQLAGRAVRLTEPPTPIALDVLAAAFAATGQFGPAVSAAENALKLATAAGDARLADEISRRLDLYRSQRPFFAKP